MKAKFSVPKVHASSRKQSAVNDWGDSVADGRNLEEEDTHEAQTKYTLGTFIHPKPWSYQIT